MDKFQRIAFTAVILVTQAVVTNIVDQYLTEKKEHRDTSAEAGKKVAAIQTARDLVLAKIAYDVYRGQTLNDVMNDLKFHQMDYLSRD